MAVHTSHIDVRAGQMERGQIVVEFRGFPGIGSVAGGAIGAEAALMRLIRVMAGVAVHRCAFEDAVLMARLAGNTDVRARQREGEHGMVYLDQIPARG